MKKNLLIIAPIFLPISKDLKYAGTERVIYSLIEGLNKKEYNTIVAASGDSKLDNHAMLIYQYKSSIWKLKENERNVKLNYAHENHYEFVKDYIINHKIDLIMDHSGFISSKAYKDNQGKINSPIIHTLHGDVNFRLDSKKYIEWKNNLKKKPIYFISISNSQKNKFENLVKIKVFDTVYNGITLDNYDLVYESNKQEYLFWIGRICKDKGTDLAIKLAKLTNHPLIIAGEVQTIYKDFYIKKVRPHITKLLEVGSINEIEREKDKIINNIKKNAKFFSNNEIFYIGALNDRQKNILYGYAKSTLVLNRWDEPFGLIMPESMATGTPVIGTDKGSIKEIIKNNHTGFVLNLKYINKNKSIDEKDLLKKAGIALHKIRNIKASDCRDHVIKNFSNTVMISSYINVFKKVLNLKNS